MTVDDVMKICGVGKRQAIRLRKPEWLCPVCGKNIFPDELDRWVLTLRSAGQTEMDIVESFEHARGDDEKSLTRYRVRKILDTYGDAKPKTIKPDIIFQSETVKKLDGTEGGDIFEKENK